MQNIMLLPCMQRIGLMVCIKWHNLATCIYSCFHLCGDSVLCVLAAMCTCVAFAFSSAGVVLHDRFYSKMNSNKNINTNNNINMLCCEGTKNGHCNVSIGCITVTLKQIVTHKSPTMQDILCVMQRDVKCCMMYLYKQKSSAHHI